MGPVQLILPKLDCTRVRRHRCTRCRRLLPATRSHWHRDASSPRGLSRRCKQCRRMADTRYHPPPISIPDEPTDPKHEDAVRLMSEQTKAGKEGRPIEAANAPEGYVTRRPFCPVCGRIANGRALLACSCGTTVNLAVIEDGVVRMDLETVLHRGHTRYRGHVDVKLLELGGSEDEAISLEKQLGSAWITVYSTDARNEWRRLAQVVRVAARERRL